MSHITCPFCRSTEHTTGYGLAAGPMGSYTFCNDCNELIEFTPDLDGLPEEAEERIMVEHQKWQDRIDAARKFSALPDAGKGAEHEE